MCFCISAEFTTPCLIYHNASHDRRNNRAWAQWPGDRKSCIWGKWCVVFICSKVSRLIFFLLSAHRPILIDFFGVIRLQLCHKDKWKTYNNTESLLLQRFWQCCMFAYISRLKLKRATVWYSFNTALRAKCKLLWNVKSAKGACVAQKEWYVSGADSMAVCVEMVKKKGLDCMWCSSVHSWL